MCQQKIKVIEPIKLLFRDYPYFRSYHYYLSKWLVENGLGTYSFTRSETPVNCSISRWLVIFLEFEIRKLIVWLYFQKMSTKLR